MAAKLPLKALAPTQVELRFPSQEDSPRHRLKKPESGLYHLVRLIRSDLKLNVFGEIFLVPPETMHEYVVATIDVKEQKLKLYLDGTQIEELNYQLR